MVEIVFVNRRPIYGLGLYADREVEAVTCDSDPDKPTLVDELDEREGTLLLVTDGADLPRIRRRLEERR